MTNLDNTISDAENTNEAMNQADAAKDEYFQKIKEELKNVTSTVGDNVKEKNMLPGQALGFDDTTIEAIYSHGYRLYGAEHYEEAVTIFRTLMLLNPTEKKYLFGMAACFHRLKEYERAVKAYLINAIFDADNPIIYFHAADCYAHLGAVELAQSSLEDVIRIAQDKPQYQVLRERAMLMLEGMRNGTFTLPKEPQDTRKWGHGSDDADTDDED